MNRLVKSALLLGAVGVGLLGAGTGAAHADIVPQIGPSDVTLQLDGNYKWSYEGQLNPAQKVLAGDFFTIYDFAGFVPGTNLQPADWSFSFSNTGVTPTGLLPLINIPGGITDNPGIPNLTWTYTGSGVIPGPADLGAFSAESVYGSDTVSPFAAEATEQSGFTAGSKVDNFGWVATPAPVTPEPCTLALLGLGAAPLALRRRRSRKA
jgi:hypothetical protein